MTEYILYYGVIYISRSVISSLLYTNDKMFYVSYEVSA